MGFFNNLSGNNFRTLGYAYINPKVSVFLECFILSVGYIWSVLEEWGKETFKNIVSHYDYGYSILRKPQKGDVLVFYHNMELLGSIPVDSPARPTTDEDAKKHPYWAKNWKYIMGLDGTQKSVFSPPVRVEDIAHHIKVLRGKNLKELHATCRCNPKITMAEYAVIVSKATYVH